MQRSREEYSKEVTQDRPGSAPGADRTAGIVFANFSPTIVENVANELDLQREILRLDRAARSLRARQPRHEPRVREQRPEQPRFR